MDYGKAAYLKADDLSKRMADLERAKTATYGSVLFGAKSGDDLTGGCAFRHTVTAQADGVCQLLLRVRVTSEAGGELALNLSFGAVGLLAETIRFDGGERDAFFMSAIKLERGATEAELSLTGPFRLVSYELIAFGYGLSTARADLTIELGATVLMVRENGTARVYALQNTTTPIFSVPCRSAHLFVGSDDSETLTFVDGEDGFSTGTDVLLPVPSNVRAQEILPTGEREGVSLRDGVLRAFSGDCETEIPVPQGRVIRLVGVSDDRDGCVVVGLSGGRYYLKAPLKQAEAMTISLGAGGER